MRTISILVLLLVASATTAQQSDHLATLRNGPIAEEAAAPDMPQRQGEDAKRMRGFPTQPPTIPHKVDGYRVNLKTNRCMTCHNRRATHMSGAPMVSVTHYTDREGNILAGVAPRRYFCQQCHVSQMDVEPMLANDFMDIDQLLRAKRRAKK